VRNQRILCGVPAPGLVVTVKEEMEARKGSSARIETIQQPAFSGSKLNTYFLVILFPVEAPNLEMMRGPHNNK
jgi:hypothetical protein